MLPSSAKTSLELRTEAATLRFLGNQIREGTPICEAITETVKNFPDFSEALQTALHQIREGDSFHTGLIGYEWCFQDFVPGMIGIGEETGLLDVTLLQAANLVDQMATVVEGGKKSSRDQIAAMIDFWMLAELMSAGLPLVRCFEILEQTSRSRSKSYWGVLSGMIAHQSLSIVMGWHAEHYLLFNTNDVSKMFQVETKYMADHEARRKDELRPQVIRDIYERHYKEIFG